MDNKPLNRIKEVMAERMVSNKELGEMLNQDTATISRWVTNTFQPTLERLLRLPKHSSVTLATLFVWTIRCSLKIKSNHSKAFHYAYQ